MQTEFKEALDSQVPVAKRVALSCIEETVKSMARAFEVPEVRAALTEAQSEESALEQRIEQCRTDRETAISDMDIEANARLDVELQALEYSLWGLVQCKLDKMNQSAGSKKEHFPLVETGKLLQDRLSNEIQKYNAELAQCNKSILALQEVSLLLNAFETDQREHDAKQQDEHKSLLENATKGRAAAVQQVVHALDQLLTAYNNEKRVECAIKHHSELGAAREVAVESNRKQAEAASYEQTCLKKALEQSLQVLQCSNGACPH